MFSGTKEMKYVTLPDFLTEAQIAQVLKLKNAKAIREQVIEPNMEEINRKLGQENDATYLAYVCEYVVTRTQGE